MKALIRQLRFTWRYLRGRAPWDSGIVPPEITAWIAAHPTPGRALDLGCGTGTTSRYLAAQGWHVVGVDFAPNAIRQARREARRQKLDDRVRFISADVSRRDLLADAAPFDLLVDVGCLHSLPPDAQAGYASNAIRLLRPGATMLLYAFLPHPSRDGRGTTGLDADRLKALLAPALVLTDVALGTEATNPARGSGWYTLRRSHED